MQHPRSGNKQPGRPCQAAGRLLEAPSRPLEAPAREWMALLRGRGFGRISGFQRWGSLFERKGPFGLFGFHAVVGCQDSSALVRLISRREFF